MILTMTALNFFSRLTYENILTPMLMARSENSKTAVGIVNTVMGLGGMLGGLLIVARRPSADRVKMIYISAALSFLLGDLPMGLGRGAVSWSLAAFCASFPVPFILTGQRILMYEHIPRPIQGSVFAVRNALQYVGIPVGILLGGFLADAVLEPLMRRGGGISGLLSVLVGSGRGSGMAVMFLCTGILGFTASVLAYRNREIRKLD